MAGRYCLSILTITTIFHPTTSSSNLYNTLTKKRFADARKLTLPLSKQKQKSNHDDEFHTFDPESPTPFKNRETKQKLYFTPECVKDLKDNNIHYQETEFNYDVRGNFEKIENFTREDFNPEVLFEKFGKNKFGKNLTSGQAAKHFFTGPTSNFDVRLSTLSYGENPRFCGLYAREFIPKGSFLGHYHGFMVFGGAWLMDGKYKELLSKYEYDYSSGSAKMLRLPVLTLKEDFKTQNTTS